MTVATKSEASMPPLSRRGASSSSAIKKGGAGWADAARFECREQAPYGWRSTTAGLPMSRRPENPLLPDDAAVIVKAFGRGHVRTRKGLNIPTFEGHAPEVTLRRGAAILNDPGFLAFKT